MSNLRKDIQDAINRHSAESGSDTPDFILAEYLADCLTAYDRAVCAREKWHGRECGTTKGPIPVEARPVEDARPSSMTELMTSQAPKRKKVGYFGG